MRVGCANPIAPPADALWRALPRLACGVRKPDWHTERASRAGISNPSHFVRIRLTPSRLARRRLPLGAANHEDRGRTERLRRWRAFLPRRLRAILGPASKERTGYASSR